MNLLNWFHDYFNPPATKAPPMDLTPAAPDNLSCFARGVIKSLEADTSNWEETCTHQGFGIKHWDSDLTIITLPALPEGIGDIHAGSVLGYQLTPEERDAVYAAALKHVLAPAEQRRNIRAQREAAEEAAKSAARKAAFERLGCP